jgi:hypothetical protein
MDWVCTISWLLGCGACGKEIEASERASIWNCGFWFVWVANAVAGWVGCGLWVAKAISDALMVERVYMVMNEHLPPEWKWKYVNSFFP